MRNAPPPTRISCPRQPPRPASRQVQPVVFSLFLYFFLNLLLTLYNKYVLFRFPFPYTLTAVHALSSAIGSYALSRRRFFDSTPLSARQNLAIVAFSLLYTLNIAVSNVSLQMVTMAFHQVVRSTTPLFTLLLSAYILRTSCSVKKLVSLLPVVIGVSFTTYGEYQFTPLGCVLTVLGTGLAAAKTVFTNVLQSGPPSPRTPFRIGPNSPWKASAFRRNFTLSTCLCACHRWHLFNA